MDAPAMVTRKHVPEDVGLRNAGEYPAGDRADRRCSAYHVVSSVAPRLSSRLLARGEADEVMDPQGLSWAVRLGSDGEGFRGPSVWDPEEIERAVR